LDGEVYARYQGRYVTISRCGPRRTIVEESTPRKPPRNNYNAGGKSRWMDVSLK
jgi:hypothetical protein